ncbi:uncharacterized protein BKA55DRAFT_713943 [Fusarium redolens]|uniref:GATA-type domain-containing protein n=1 Tax=Fusarium redolens TaxID=48865 RepID=A0A9P9G2A7_FUSRE|nr:uncharacterized protein BKA55DRAFT_713943 [Fusarium redolens]KAH7231829.1 hypothetical protein BKA55DRAFT_713943 [Fusarium redolens]
MTSSVEPRKHADYHVSPNRQSLPSISEFIQDTKPAAYTHRPLSSVQTDSRLSLPLASSLSQGGDSIPASPTPAAEDAGASSSFQTRTFSLSSTIPPSRSGFLSAPLTTSWPDTSCPYPTPPRHDFATQAGYDASVNRHPRSWSYRDSLIKLVPHPASFLTVLKRIIELLNERAREGAKMKEENHAPVSVYAMQPSSGTTGTTKRLACASQTGRCHKCGRTQTPEWRRGPDGIRTLCNACGLHYAKLKRKHQIKASSIRPEPEKALQLRGSELLQDGLGPGAAIPCHFSTTVQIFSKSSTIKRSS